MTQERWWCDEDFCPVQPKALRKGDNGEGVRHLQQLLKNKGYTISVDGDFGGQTERVVRQYQRDTGLIDDGIAGDKTMDMLHGDKQTDRLLKRSDIVDAAKQLGVDVACIMAVSEVESSGKGFFSNGDPAILYERHVMYRQLRARKIDTSVYVKNQPNIVNPVSGGYLGGVREYNRLAAAKIIHVTSGLESCSWGSYQIMGYHAVRIGYPSVEAFVKEMYDGGERAHLMAFVRFIKEDPTLHKALLSHDWATFARYYNGKNYAKNQYDVKMKRAYERYSALEAA